LCCVQKRLIVELDGGHHADQRDQDAARTAYLAEHGYRVIRFRNEPVNREMR
jgi:very-short-patch-repair endonuclease